MDYETLHHNGHSHLTWLAPESVVRTYLPTVTRFSTIEPIWIWQYSTALYGFWLNKVSRVLQLWEFCFCVLITVIHSTSEIQPLVRILLYLRFSFHTKYCTYFWPSNSGPNFRKLYLLISVIIDRQLLALINIMEQSQSPSFVGYRRALATGRVVPTRTRL